VLLGSAGAAVGASALAACGPKEDAHGEPPLRIHANDSTTFVGNFNPYSGQALAGGNGLIYEPLMQCTAMDPENPEPWLAKKVTWNEDGTELTVHLRDDVTFTDGEQLDAEDVIFTFEMMRDNAATNTAALKVKAAKAEDPYTVRIAFEKTSFAQEADICSVPIVPEHIFSGFDPSKEVISDPVGSGPYVLDRYSEQLYTFIRNEKHWAVDEFEPTTLTWPAFTTQTLNTALQAGEIDWSGGYIANIDKIFVDRDPDRRGYWYPGGGVVNLTFNLEKDLWQDLDLRKAINLAVDRKEIADIVYQKNVVPPHPTGLPRPTFEDFIADEYKDLAFEVDIDKANKILDDAGYKEGEDGIRVAPDGTSMSFDLKIPSGYNDWVTASQILGPGLKKIGIALTAQGISIEKWLDARDSGDYDVTIAAVSAGQNPWTLYRSWLSSEYRTKGDEPVISNFQRWYDDDTDDLLAKYSDTEDEATQREAVEGLQKIVVEQLPALPIIVAPNWFNYNTEFWTGYPSDDDPYALGAPTGVSDRTLILRKLTRSSN
jgi:peptide/nickel transport system substrate-binding protein